MMPEFDPKKLPERRFELPTLAEATEGWRAWKVALEIPRYGVPPKLVSASANYYWTPRRRAMADCHKCEPDMVPGSSCTCGFYSAKSLEHLISMGYHRYDIRTGFVCVVGQVANWGNVVEGTQGWRAQYSYPIKIYVPFDAAELLKPLKKGYGIPTYLASPHTVLARQREREAKRLAQQMQDYYHNPEMKGD
jgi:hypothetical protein